MILYRKSCRSFLKVISLDQRDVRNQPCRKHRSVLGNTVDSPLEAAFDYKEHGIHSSYKHLSTYLHIYWVHIQNNTNKTYSTPIWNTCWLNLWLSPLSTSSFLLWTLVVLYLDITDVCPTFRNWILSMLTPTIGLQGETGTGTIWTSSYSSRVYSCLYHILKTQSISYLKLI